MTKRPDPTIRRLVRDPLSFDLSNYEVLYQKISNGTLPDDILRKTTLRILDLAEDGIFKSTADKGFAGFLNNRSRRIRQERYRRLIRKKNFRQNPGNTVVLAEGDSWFEHPLIMDILDHLEFHDDLAIFSLAYGADWLDNILFEGEYIDQISLLNPDVFLVSGGGNDIIEGGKLAIFLKAEKNDCPQITYEKLIARFPAVGKWPEKDGVRDLDIKECLKSIGIEFFGFLNIMLFQYYYMFRSIEEKYPNMIFFTQGYDYAYPRPKIVRSWYNAFQRTTNWIMDSGNWIEAPMKQSKIFDKEKMHDFIKLVLGLFNEGLIELSTKSRIKNLYHIDNRNLAKEKDWFDEIHIKDYKYMQIAETYHYAIDKVRNQKDISVKVFESAKIWQHVPKPGFFWFIKGFRSTSPRLETLGLQLLGCVVILGLWWTLFPHAAPCGDYSCKLPFTLFVLGMPLLLYMIRIFRSVWLSWRFWRK